MSGSDQLPGPSSRAPEPGLSRRGLLAGAAGAVGGTVLAFTFPETAQARPAAGAAAPASPDTGGTVRFTSPTGHVLTGLTDIEVTAPAGTTAVRFSMDDVAFSELTDLYSQDIGLPPVWRTATDGSWFDPGEHTLTVEADTPAGRATQSVRVTTVRHPVQPAGRTVLDGAWLFATTADLPSGALTGAVPPASQPGFDESPMTEVLVPGAFGAVRDRWNDDSGTLGVYRRTVTLTAPEPGKRVLLTLESCFFACQVYVNGAPAGTAQGGYLPEVFDATEHLVAGDNLIAVVTDNRTSSLFQLNWSLYWNWGGLFASVHLDTVPAAGLTGVTATGAADGTLTLHASGINTTGAAQEISAAVALFDPSGSPLPGRHVAFALPAGSGVVDASPVSFTLPSVQRWELETPRLYQVRVSPAGQPPVTVRTGFRDVAVAGDRIHLNGEALPQLRGFNRHTDYPGLGRCQPDGLAHRELEQLRDKGFRIFRPAHYPTTPAELEAADELGLLVIEEVNVTQVFDPVTLTSPKVVGFAKDRLARMIRRDRGHPALIAYSVGNENGTDSEQGADYVRQLTAFGKDLDPTRLYTHMTGWGSTDKAFAHDDFACTNIYDGWYTGSFADLTDPGAGTYSMVTIQQAAGGKPVMLSEYGAEAVATATGYGKGTYYYQGLMIDEYHRLLAGRPGVAGTMYWTSSEFMLSPGSDSNPGRPMPGFHTKGLRTYWREPKLGWRVMFSPGRIDAIDAVLTAPDGAVDQQVRMTVREVLGRNVRGTLEITPPPGTSADRTSIPFTLTAGGTWSTTVRLTGTGVANGATGEVHAVFDADTEAQPRLLKVVTLAPLEASFNSIGVTTDGGTTASDFTQSGSCYSAQALAAAGIVPGGLVRTPDGPFTWPDVAAGRPDNVAATGQGIALSGSGTALAVLGAATYGKQSGTGTLYYTDGTHAPFTLALDDWFTTSPTTGDHVAAGLDHYNVGGRSVTRDVSLWSTAIPLDSTKTLSAVVLPSTTPPGAALHVFALTVV